MIALMRNSQMNLCQLSDIVGVSSKDKICASLMLGRLRQYSTILNIIPMVDSPPFSQCVDDLLLRLCTPFRGPVHYQCPRVDFLVLS